MHLKNKTFHILKDAWIAKSAQSLYNTNQNLLLYNQNTTVKSIENLIRYNNHNTNIDKHTKNQTGEGGVSSSAQEILSKNALVCQEQSIDYFSKPSAISSLEEAQREARLIFAHCLNLDRVQLHMHVEFLINQEQNDYLEECLQRRLRGEPLAYIFGKKEFFSLDFFVTKDTLIPRPETEMLVEMALEFAKTPKEAHSAQREGEAHILQAKYDMQKHKEVYKIEIDKTNRTYEEVGEVGEISKPSEISDISKTSETSETGKIHPLTLLDLGCGTGCISLSFLCNFPHAHVYLCDISENTLDIAKKNSEHLALRHKTSFILEDFTQSNFIKTLLALYPTPNKDLDKNMMHFDIICSNPPYIPIKEYEQLHISVKDYEPEIALISHDISSISLKNSRTENALFHIQAVIEIAKKCLKPQGLLLIEHGYNQGELVRALCTEEFFTKVETIVDYGGIPRFLRAIKK